MSRPTLTDAAAERHKRLQAFQRVVDVCNCLWPLVIYRNGDGHSGTCPAHVPIGERYDEMR